MLGLVLTNFWSAGRRGSVESMVSDIVDGRYTIVTKECNHRRLQLGLAEEWGGGVRVTDSIYWALSRDVAF